MAQFLVSVIVLVLVCAAHCIPIEVQDSGAVETTSQDADVTQQGGHKLWKRFINPSLTYGGFADTGLSKMRTKRSEEDCEKLSLCKLHARSSRNFFAAFELYFVNKENARLWDHHAHSLADCQRRFNGCYEE